MIFCLTRNVLKNRKMARNKHNTPGIIKFPFWQMAYENPEAVYACVNRGQADAPREIADRSICIDGDIGETLQKLKPQDPARFVFS